MTDTGILGVEYWLQLLYLALIGYGIMFAVGLTAIWLQPKTLVELMTRGVVFRWFVQGAAIVFSISLVFGSFELYLSFSKFGLELLRAQGDVWAVQSALADSIASAASGFRFMMIAAIIILICSMAPLLIPPASRASNDDNTKPGEVSG